MPREYDLYRYGGSFQMKIAIICDVLGKENNGTTVAAMNLIRSLKAKGHEVHVVCPDEDRRGDEGFYIVKKILFIHFFFSLKNIINFIFGFFQSVRKPLGLLYKRCHS